MKLCDITIAYNESSGGIRTYIDEKRRHLLRHTPHEHLLVVPGEADRVEAGERATTVFVESPLLPGQDEYRAFLRPDKVKQVLLDHAPDIVELGSYYVEPWAAFAYRDALREDGRNCVIGCFFHTDVAEAYVGAPLRALAHDWFDGWSATLTSLGEALADFAASGVERYVGSIFALCDLAFVSSPAQAARLKHYGIEDVSIVPLGVDLELFHPGRRSAQVRAAHGAGPDDLVLIYAGRLSAEKHVLTLVEALQALPEGLHPLLWMMGQGPLRSELEAIAEGNGRLRLLPYERDRQRFARLLASADVYVTAGPHETFALSVIEAQASGLPVVGVDGGALRERVTPDVGYLGPVGDGRAMADNIVRAFAQRDELGAQARRNVERSYSWHHTFRSLLACYDAALARLDGTLPSAAEHAPDSGSFATD